ncbi:MAG TPA: DUF4394 domain-containing protein [Vicinamibacterales bacterium]
MARALALTVVGLASALMTQPVEAATAYGLTPASQIVVFDTGTPATIATTLTVSGLQAGEFLVAIDIRPSTGQLYAMANTGRLFIINTSTGAAQPVGTGTVPVSANFGMDFDPVTDLIRVVSADQNLRVNPDTGAVAGTDAALTPAASVVAAAYTNNVAGAAATTLFGIDWTADTLVRIGGENGMPSPDGGAVTSIGALGVNTSGEAGFDIAANTGIAYASLTVGSASSLYTIDLTSGAATAVGPIGSGVVVRGLAILSRGTTLYGVTQTNQLVRFHSAAPATVLATTPITGLQAAENVLGIDRRPSTGELYLLGSTSRLYRLDPATGQATEVGTEPFTPSLSGTEFAFDFDPVADVIRVVSDTGQNLRLNPDTGAAAGTDTGINPPGSSVTAAAYTNNVDGATTTTLFGLDATGDALVRIGGVSGTPSPNDGTVTPIGPLGVDVTAMSGFDISPFDNVAFAVLNVGGTARLYTVDLASGGATEIGPVNGSIVLRGVTAFPDQHHFAEGSTGIFFDTDLLLLNPNATPAPVTVTYLAEDGSVFTSSQTLPAQSRTTVNVDTLPGLESAAFSSIVSSNLGLPLVAERTMRWDATGYGLHTEKAVPSPARTWYFAEGSQGFFHTFYLFTNPAPVANSVELEFLLENGATVTRTYTIAAQSRLTVYAGAIQELVNQSFGMVATFDIAGAAERAMYFGTSPVFSAGSASAGVVRPSTDWFLAEGATGGFFTTFVLLANPNPAPATVQVTYLREGGGQVTKTHTIPGERRLTINVALEDPSLAATAVATSVSSDIPIVVERAQYWPYDPSQWLESHNSFGVTQTASKWGLAEGRVGGENGYQTFVLLANPNATPANVTLVFLREGGTPITKTALVPANGRLTVSTGPGTLVPELTEGNFGVVVTADQPIFVERALYGNANGVFWAAGSNATGTALP